MFVTTCITTSILESHRFTQASPKPTEEQLMMAIDSFQTHVDRNKPYNNSLMVFWPMAYNQTSGYWQANPVNLLAGFNATDKIPVDLLVDIMDALGLKNLTKYVEGIFKAKDTYIHVFRLCADMDDTFLNLGLGATLYELKDEYPSAWKLWATNHNNLTSVFDAVKKYAYRPFHNDSNVNTIDSRTYMYLRHFLDEAKAKGKDVALVATWAQNLPELRKEINKGVAMPLNVNNVDVTVCANTVFGLTASVLSGLVSADWLKDPVVEHLYHNSSALMAFEIQTNLSSRPDLSLLYYPSHMEFNWFVTRTVAILDAAKKMGPLPVSVMEEVYNMLVRASKNEMTDFIVRSAKYDDLGYVYYDDFMGDGDFTADAKPLNRGEDRIFTTAMAVNALLYTWTDFNAGSKTVTWKTDAPQTVKQIVEKSVNWLELHTLDGNYDPWNAFFSGSAKGPTTSSHIYPANRYEMVNGTVIDDWSKHPNLMTEFLGVEGHIPEEKYAAMLKEKHFGRYSPIDFPGYNAASGFFPLWSSEPYTYSTVLLALTRFHDLVG